MTGASSRPVLALDLRSAALRMMKADYGLTEMIPRDSLYPSTVPASRTFPFGRWEPPLSTPFPASGSDSTGLRFAVSVFAKPVLDPHGVILTEAESVVAAAAGAIQRVLDGSLIRLSCGVKAWPEWTGTIVRQDRHEAGAWSATVAFAADVSG